MQKKIQQLAEGKFDYNIPNIFLSVEKVELDVLEQTQVSGSFFITSENRVKMCGTVSSSNPRMECLTPNFDGVEAEIKYQFHSEGLTEGDVQKGEFFIVCNHGEYNLSFSVAISKAYPQSSHGKIKTLGEFVKLAAENYEEAYHIFYSNPFAAILKEEKERLLYQAMRTLPQSMQKMEAFLTAAGKKKKAKLLLLQNSQYDYGVSESKKALVQIQKSYWGAVCVHVSSDADFLIPLKKTLTDADFSNNVCLLAYEIDAGKLHAGKNYGRLCFETAEQYLCYEVLVCTEEKKEKGQCPLFLELQKGQAQLMQLYIDYRLKKIVTGVWAKRSIEILNRLSEIEPENVLWNLMKAQALLINRQKQEASWILSDYKHSCTEKEKLSPQRGYYLYLCTLMEREDSYVDKLTDEIEQIFHKNPKNSMLFWILLFLKEEYYCDSARRLRALETWTARGNYSPYFYIEAYYLICQDSSLLTKLESFEIAILKWAAKQDALTKEIANQAGALLEKQKDYNKKLYPILEKCCQVEESDEMLAAVCAYLIRGQKFEPYYHGWYEKAVVRQIRITNLYEAFLLSMDCANVTAIPLGIEQYFSQNGGVSYKNMAVFYVNLIAAKEKQPDLYAACFESMVQFAAEQMRQGHMDDNLAIVYRKALSTGILDTELAHAGADIFFIHKLSVENPKAAKAYLLQKELAVWQEITIVNECAYFKADTKEYEILLCDVDGNCFADKKDYRDEALLHPETYLKQCMELAPDEVSYALYYFCTRKEGQDIKAQDIKAAKTILASEKIGKSYKAWIWAQIIRFYQKTGDTALLQESLKKVCIDGMVREDRSFVIEQLIEHEFFEKAYELVCETGYDFLHGSAKDALCSYEIAQCGYEKKEYLLKMARSCFASGTCSHVVLRYLCRFYNGPTKRMAQVWSAAKEHEIDAMDLEKRILVQMLYSTEYVKDVEQIYDSYSAAGGEEEVCMAYLSYFSHYYLMSGMVVPQHIFEQIKMRYEKQVVLNNACRLGLLKYMAGKEKFSQENRDMIDELLAEYIRKNRYFAFYQKFDKRLMRKYHLYDKIFLEYCTKPMQHVQLSYSINGSDFVQEELTEMYDGIYGKPIILIANETISYYISELFEGEWKIMESGKMTGKASEKQECQTRYDFINKIADAYMKKDSAALSESIKQYYEKDHAVKEIFKLL